MIWLRVLQEHIRYQHRGTWGGECARFCSITCLKECRTRLQEHITPALG
jgi:hypothetical protein